jgi:hypothetical protein
LDRSYNSIFRHIGSFGILNRQAYTEIGIRAGANFFGSKGEFFDQFGKVLSPPGILSTSSSLDFHPLAIP